MKRSNQEEQIKQEIQRLHDNSSGDFQSLLRQVENNRRKVVLNLPQMVSSQATQRIQILEWGRGTGKTTQRGLRWSDILRQMPRSTGLLIGPSYQFILTRIVPSLVQGLEMFGLYQDLHYFIGTPPPRAWRNAWGRAYQPPKKQDRYITFWNGVGVHLISQDVPGDGRGLNSDWIDGDEAGMLDQKKLQEHTDPTLRGTNNQAFKNSLYFGSKFYTSSTPLAPEGQWFIDYEQKAMQDPGKVCFISATCEHNLHNLREGFLQEAEEEAYAQWVFDAEYKNKRPKFSKDSFYSLLDKDRHCYNDYNYDFYKKVGQAVDCRGDSDLVKGSPLILGVDWGAAINCLTVSQYLRSINEFRTIKSMYVLGDERKIQDDLFNDFMDYYRYHDTTEVELWYDNTGNLRTGNTRKTRAEQARDLLRSRGWKVKLMTSGTTNPMHEWKHMVWQAILKEDNRILPSFRMNIGNCRELYLSMRNAKTSQGRNGELKKDKSSERKGSIPRQEATDLSDAEDSPIFGKFFTLLRLQGSMLPHLKVST